MRKVAEQINLLFLTTATTHRLNQSRREDRLKNYLNIKTKDTLQEWKVFR
jgi:hypothetical protein